MPLFGPLPDDDFARLETNARLVKFEDAQMLFTQGAPSEAVYKLTSGSVKLDRVLPDGRRQVLGFILPGHYLGISMYSARSYGAQALGPTAALRYDLAAFRSAALDDPAMLRGLYELAKRQLDSSHDLMTTVGRMSAEERVAWFVLDFGEAWERCHGARDSIPLPMTRTDIADHLGLTIETVSRTFTKLAHDGIIVVEPKSVRVLDLARLKKLAKRPQQQPARTA
jgi:CRP/FNR family transcriptional regulator, anaerobic regulatory protein